MDVTCRDLLRGAGALGLAGALPGPTAANPNQQFEIRRFNFKLRGT